MRAAMIERFGEPPRLAETADPQPGPGQALIEVSAASLNPLDLAIASGRHYTQAPELPYVPGSEGVGVVVRAESLAPGARVRFESRAGLGGSGSLAEVATAPEDGLIELPTGADDAVAAALGIAGLAAWLSLESRAELRGGEVVLVLGASGAVGQVAVQAARLLGARRVIAAARSADGLARAREAGADVTVELADLPVAQLTEAFREAAGGDVDVVIDPLWGEPAVAALDALGTDGRLVNLGQSAGAEATLTSASVRGRGRTIVGHSNFLTPPDVKREAYRAMLDHATAGRLRIDVEVMPLADVARAWEAQSRSPHRKIVVRP